MKKTTFALLCALAALLAVASCRPGGAAPRQGNADIVSSHRSVSAFDAIEVSGNAAVVFHTSHDFRVLVSADSNLARSVQTRVRRRTLHIGVEERRPMLFTELTVTVFAPHVSSITLSGAARFETEDTLTARHFSAHLGGSTQMEGIFAVDTFSADLSGTSQLSGRITAGSVAAAIAGSSMMTAEGNGEHIQAALTGSGSFSGREFRTNTADVSVSGSGTMHLWVVENLRADASGFGVIHYRGNPRIDFSGSGSGRLESEQ